MGIMEAEKHRLLLWFNPQKLAAAQNIEDEEERRRAIDEIIRRFDQDRLKEERHTYVRSCIGEKVWIHLPSDDRMALYEGVVVGIELRDGDLVAKLKDPRWPDLIEFNPDVTMPHFYRKHGKQK